MHVLLIGLGNMGSKYLRKLKELGISPVLCDIDPAKENLCGECPFYCHFGDVKEEVSRVIVAVDPEDHVSIAREFLEKGIPVLLEKPPAVSSSEFEDIWEDPNLEISEIELYSYPVRRFPRGLRVYNIRAERLGRGRGYIDPFWDLAWHDLYLMQYLLGEVEVREVSRGEVWEMRGTAGGVPFTIRVAWDYMGEPSRKWVLDTEKGEVLMDFLREEISFEGGKVVRREGDKLREMVTDFLKGVRREGSTRRAMNNIRILESLPF
ncbi:MAG: Gfo/Idh/MocA family oxidoreductase [Aquificota bacterium]|nr:Gfo/Idh/MocA family oxidoreductase [Aquificota bacterium]